MLNDSVATRRKFNRENLILCGFMVSTFDPKKNISEPEYCDSLFWREKKEQNFETRLSVLKAKCSQEINVSFELKKSQSFHWSGHAPIFCSILLDPRFYFVPVEVQVDSQYMYRKTSQGLSKGPFPLGCLRWSALMIASIFLSSTLLTVLSERWRYDHSL